MFFLGVGLILVGVGFFTKDIYTMLLGALFVLGESQNSSDEMAKCHHEFIDEKIDRIYFLLGEDPSDLPNIQATMETIGSVKLGDVKEIEDGVHYRADRILNKAEFDKVFWIEYGK